MFTDAFKHNPVAGKMNIPAIPEVMSLSLKKIRNLTITQV